MYKIVLQVGHQNIKYNSIETLRGSTGAPTELEKNLKITNRTCELLRERGFEVRQTDANANDDKTITYPNNWDLYLAVHCDADTPSNGGFADYPYPPTDGATLRSQEIASKISAKFFPESGIVYRPERIQKSDNIKYYYMWKYLSASTPCVLIEMGEAVDPHDSVILNDTERCAIALARGVCHAFNVQYDNPIEPETPEESDCEEYEQEIENLEYINKEQATMIDDLRKGNERLVEELSRLEQQQCPDLDKCPSWLKRLNNYL
jgi:hypothetical protein